MKSSDSELVKKLIRDHYNLLNEAGAVVISPGNLADCVYLEIDPREIAPSAVRYVAILGLNQLARSVCRERFASEERELESKQESLFEGLQPRYPADRDGDEVYVARLHLTYEERLANVRRLRSESRAKSAHADALEAETQSLVDKGQLVMEGVA